MRPILLSILIAALPCLGQTLHLAAPNGHRGQAVTLEVSLDGADSLQPVALQFEIQYSPKYLDLDLTGSAAGAAAQGVGKKLTCFGRWKKPPNSYLAKCIVAGSKEPIPNGKVALLSFKVPLTAEYGSYKVTVEDAQAVTPALKAVKLKKADGAIQVGRKTD